MWTPGNRAHSCVRYELTHMSHLNNTDNVRDISTYEISRTLRPTLLLIWYLLIFKFGFHKIVVFALEEIGCCYCDSDIF